MKQFWTPLARALGFQLDHRASASASRSTPSHTHFPLLEKSLMSYAREQLLPAAKLKAEISLDGVLSLKSLHLTPSTLPMRKEIDLWRQQGSTEELIHWICNVPFSAEDIRLWMNCENLNQLTIGDADNELTRQQHVSAYAFESPGSIDGSHHLKIRSEWSWISVEKPSTLNESTADQFSSKQFSTEFTTPDLDTPNDELTLEIVDEQGSRRLRLRHTEAFWVIGKPKPMLDQQGHSLQPVHAQSIDFKGHSAQYVAVIGRHVSGMHAAVRRMNDQWEWIDLNSTNGSYIHSDRVIFDSEHWQPLEPHNPIYLGGPASDDRRLSPSISLLKSTASSWVSAQATPLRPSFEKIEFPSMEWLVSTDDGCSDMVIRHLPFTLGRDSRCDGVISASHTLVSRRHLVIEAIDDEQRRWKIRDISSQGLTKCSSASSVKIRDGIWIPFDEEVVMGQSISIRGVKVRLHPKPLTA